MGDPSTAEQRRRVLVVDDDVDTCRNLRDILTDMGYEAETAHNGPEALQRIRDRAFDVALLDLKMPGMDGLTLYHRIKELASGTVAIIVTAYATGDTAEQALQAGAWHILSKPVDLSKLLPLVGEAVQQPLVMVIDDDPALCASLWDVLRDQGYRVCIARDQETARDQLQKQDYRVVLVDMKLPEGDGGSMYRLVRDANPLARVVLITGFRHELQQLIDRVIAEGAEAVCYKPFDMPRLLEMIKSLSDA